MYCKLKNKEVSVIVPKKGKNDPNKIEFKYCSGNYRDICGERVRIQCDMAEHEECLLNK